MDFYNYQDARSYSVAYAKTRCVGSQRRAIKRMLRNQSVDEFPLQDGFYSTYRCSS